MISAGRLLSGFLEFTLIRYGKNRWALASARYEDVMHREEVHGGIMHSRITQWTQFEAPAVTISPQFPPKSLVRNNQIGLKEYNSGEVVYLLLNLPMERDNRTTRLTKQGCWTSCIRNTPGLMDKCTHSFLAAMFAQERTPPTTCLTQKLRRSLSVSRPLTSPRKCTDDHAAAAWIFLPSQLSPWRLIGNHLLGEFIAQESNRASVHLHPRNGCVQLDHKCFLQAMRDQRGTCEMPN